MINSYINSSISKEKGKSLYIKRWNCYEDQIIKYGKLDRFYKEFEARILKPVDEKNFSRVVKIKIISLFATLECNKVEISLTDLKIAGNFYLAKNFQLRTNWWGETISKKPKWLKRFLNPKTTISSIKINHKIKIAIQIV